MAMAFKRHDFDSLIAEGAMAGCQAELDPETQWHGPQHPLFDISSSGGLTVDVKTAWPAHVRDAQGAKIESVGFMGSSREVEVRPGVSHYGLVILNGHSEVVIEGDLVTVTSEHRAIRYLVPASVINEMFRPSYRMNGTLGTGRNLYLPLAVAEEFLVRGKDVPSRTAIIVNTSRRWKKRDSAAKRLRVIEGDWPVHGSRGAQQMHGLVGALVIGNAKGIVRDIRLITAVIPNGDRFRFETAPTDQLSELIGQRTPEGFRFIPGQQWPTRFVDSEGFGSLC